MDTMWNIYDKLSSQNPKLPRGGHLEMSREPRLLVGGAPRIPFCLVPFQLYTCSNCKGLTICRQALSSLSFG